MRAYVTGRDSSNPSSPNHLMLAFWNQLSCKVLCLTGIALTAVVFHGVFPAWGNAEESRVGESSEGGENVNHPPSERSFWDFRGMLVNIRSLGLHQQRQACRSSAPSISRHGLASDRRLAPTKAGKHVLLREAKELR